MGALTTAVKVTFLPDDSPFRSTLLSVDQHRPWRGEEKARLLSTWWLPQEKPISIFLFDSFLKIISVSLIIVYLVTYDSHTLSFNALDMIFFDSLNIFKVPDLKIFKSNVWTFPEIISIDWIFPLIHGPHFPISLHVLHFFGET